MPNSSCPGPQELEAYLLGKLTVEALETVAEHLESCTACQAVLTSGPGQSDSLLTRLQLRRAGAVPTADAELHQLLEEAKEIELKDTAVAGTTVEYKQPRPDQPPAPEPGQLDQYRLLAELGTGGMGKVYKALHVKLERHVAVKVIHRGGTLDRFQREIRAMGKLTSHPHLVYATDAREADGVVLLVMDLVEGIDLAQLSKKLGPLALADACDLVRQAALGLQHAHEHGLVHRDIKPSNLMLSRDGLVKVLDLGLARESIPRVGEAQTATGQVMGTYDYIAPEQALDASSVDIRADIYSLGCTLFQLLTGRAPFAEHAEPMQKLMAHLQGPFPPVQRHRPDIADPLAAVLERMVAHKTEDRFRKPAEVARALEPWSAGRNLYALLAALQIQPATRSGAVQAEAGTSSPDAPSTVDLPRKPGVATKKSNAGRYWVAAAALILIAGSLAAWKLWPGSNPPTATVAQAPPATLPSTEKGQLPPLRHPDGRALAQQFPIKVELLGGVADPAGVVHLHEGKFVELRLEVDRDCYVGVWHVDDQGTVVQLFPNRYEKDHLVRKGQPRKVPGDERYGIKVTPSKGKEYVHVFASTRHWEPVPGSLRGGPEEAYEVFTTAKDRDRLQELLRGMVLVAKEPEAKGQIPKIDPNDPRPLAAEVVLPIQVEGRKP